MKEYEKALKTYQEGLKLDPQNQELLDGVKRYIHISFIITYLVSYFLLSCWGCLWFLKLVSFWWSGLVWFVFYFSTFSAFHLSYFLSRRLGKICLLLQDAVFILQMCWANKQGKSWRSDSRGAQRKTGNVSLHYIILFCLRWRSSVMVNTCKSISLIRLRGCKIQKFKTSLRTQ